MEIQKWLSDPKRDYKKGVELYKRHKGEDRFYSFFASAENPSPESSEFKMLIQRLERVSRVVRQQRKRGAKPEVKDTTKKIKVDKLPEAGGSHVEGLRNNPKYVSKILSLNWKDLEQRDRQVFFDKKEYFEYKRALFLETSRIEKDLQALHTKMKNSEDAEERKGIVNELKSLEDGKGENWKKIDDWETEIDLDDQQEDPQKKGVEMQKEIENLKSNIRRTESKIKNQAYKTKKTEDNARQKVKEMKEKLERLENETA